MAIPSGSGTEVLKSAVFASVSTSAVKILDGVANHIYTILSITVCETAGAAEAFNLRISTDGGSNAFFILVSQPLGINKTFVFNDRLVISGTHELIMNTNSSANLDVTIHYIDQDWS